MKPNAGNSEPEPTQSHLRKNDESMPFEKDFLRGSDKIVEHLTKTLDQSPDVGQPYTSQSWDTITRLAWRPAWSIRSRRGALEPLISWWRKRKSASTED